jgi:GntR family transcriptional regulator
MKPSSTGARTKIRRLVEERMSPGDRLPSEQELAGRFAVSRNTVREALEELETLGLIRRRWGHGTFVSPNIGLLQKWLNELLPITEVVRRASKECRLEHSAYRRRALPKVMTFADITPEFSQVWEIERVYSADRVPFIVLRDYLPVRHGGKDLDPSRLGDSVWEMMRTQWGTAFSYATAEITAVGAPAEVAGRLGIKHGVPVMRDCQYLYSEADVPVACTESFLRTDVISLQIIRRYRPA